MSFESIANRLSALYGQRADLGLKAWKAEQDIAARQAMLTPAEGWPGSNDKAREASRVALFAMDTILTRVTVDRNAAQAELMKLAGLIEAAEAERRASEWTARMRLVEVLERRDIAPNGRGDRAERSHDDVLQTEMDRAPF